MPTKKRSKKTVKAKRPVTVRSAKPISASQTGGRAKKIVGKNLFLFIVLFLVSVLLGAIVSNPSLDDLFWILAMLTGFVAVALLIIWFALIIVQATRK
jgi:hypothetical protein